MPPIDGHNTDQANVPDPRIAALEAELATERKRVDWFLAQTAIGPRVFDGHWTRADIDAELRLQATELN